MAELILYRRGTEVLRFTLSSPRVVLGRGERCDVVIPDPAISWQHIAIWRDGEQWKFSDLSGQGVEVAGASQTEGDVGDGTEFDIGRWRALFRMQELSEELPATDMGAATMKFDMESALFKEAGKPVRVRIRKGSGESVDTLVEDSISVGTSKQNDIVLDDPFVSSHHLHITRNKNRFMLTDHTSTNGTWLGDVRLYEAEVPFNTQLSLGKVSISLEPVGDATQTTAAALGIIGNSPSIKGIVEFIERVAPSFAPISIYGESGTGKELVAHAMHNHSPRAGQPFIILNCAAIPRELIESELFGHERGAFTGATAMRKGAFEEANGGTLFLDEVGELPTDLQPKLLRVLESGEVRRIGSSKSMRVDVRIVSATNRDLMRAVRTGEFREDLYYRLCVVPLTIPPLRNRRGDIPMLVQHFLQSYLPRGTTLKITPKAMELLCAHSWAGNVREVRNVVHRALLLRRGANIEAEDISFAPELPKPVETTDPFELVPGLTLEQLLDRAERIFVEATLSRCDNNRERAARELGVSRSTLFKRLKEWGLTADPENEGSGQA